MDMPNLPMIDAGLIGVAVVLIAAVAFLINGCAGKQIGEAKAQLDQAKAKYENEVRPSAQTAFRLVFGVKHVNPDGSVVYDTDPRPPSVVEEPGIQDIIYANLGSFDEKTREKLIEANDKAIEYYEAMRRLDAQIESGIQSADQFLTDLQSLQGGDLSSPETQAAAANIAVTMLQAYAKTSSP